MIKCTVTNNNNIPFPKLMVSENALIVFFSKTKQGIVIKGNDTFKIGNYSTDWNMNVFEDYNKIVTIQNICKE